MTGQPLVTSIPVRVAGTPSLKKLQSTFQGGQVVLSWPAPSTGFALQGTERFEPQGLWANAQLPVITTNNQQIVTLDATNTAKFFRLRLD